MEINKIHLGDAYELIKSIKYVLIGNIGENICLKFII